MTAAMLSTITIPPTSIVQPGACTASDAPVVSHAHAKANVEITRRTSCETVGLATAAASAAKITRSANTPNTPIEDVTPHLAVRASPARVGLNPAASALLPEP